MRRSIVSYLSLFVLLASICVLAPVGAAGAASASPAVCPQETGIVPCCPTPVQSAHKSDAQAACCQPSTCCASGSSSACCGTSTPCCGATVCASGLTIASSPNPSIEGRKVVISGAMLNNSTAGAQVTLWQEVAGQSSFTNVGTAKLDSAGQYSFTMNSGVVKANRTWYVTAQGIQSPSVIQKVAALVAFSPAHASVAAGKPVALRGSVTPAHAGEVVLIEQKAAGKWRIVGRPRLGHASTFAGSHRFIHAGVVKLRAVLPSDSRNQGSNSRTVTLRVR